MVKNYCGRCGLELPDDVETSYNCPMCGSATVIKTSPIPKQRKTDRPQDVSMVKNYCGRCGLELPDDAETPYNCLVCGPTTVTKTPPIPKQRKTDRPQGVTVISVLSIIGGLIATFFGLFVAAMFTRGVGLGGMMGTLAGYFILVGIALFFGGLFSMFVAWGLWKGAEWAWTLGVILGILGIIGGIFAIPYGLIGVFVYGLILYYLFKPNVKTWFKKKQNTEPTKEIIQPSENLLNLTSS